MPTVRQVRLCAGLVLFCYVSSHLANHAIGLISLQATEDVRLWFVAAWRSVPGTLVLYTAFGAHLALVLISLYRRRTLSIPPKEAIQLASGLLLPVLLLDHIKGTRIANVLYAQPDTYTRVIWNLWHPLKALQQSGILVLAWLHGCLGIHFAFRHRRWYAKAAPAFRVVAFALPILALLGFWTIGSELDRLRADPRWFSEHVAPLLTLQAAEQSSLARIGSALTAGYAGLAGLILAGMSLRAAIDRLRRRIVRLTYPNGQIVSVPRGFSVLEASRAAGIPHTSICGGRGRCSTCRIRVQRATGVLPAPGPDERRTLQRIAAPANVRLACQLRPQADLSVVALVKPKGVALHAEPEGLAAFGIEREVAILFIDLRRWTGLAEGYLPYDLVYLLNRYFEVVGKAVRANGGLANQFVGDSVMAIFGLNRPVESACRSALEAAAEIAQRMEALNRELAAEGFAALEFGLGIHTGPAVVAEFGYENVRTFTGVGDTINTASRLQELTKEHAACMVIATEVIRRAGIALAGMDGIARVCLSIRGRTQAVEVHIVKRPADLPVALRSIGESDLGASRASVQF